jgi:hypothetical protein
MTPQRLYLAVRKTDSGSEVHIAGTTHRNPDLFRQRFEHWMKTIQG